MFGRDRGDRGALVALAIVVAGGIIVAWLGDPPNQIAENYTQTNSGGNNSQYNQEGGEAVYFGVLKLHDTLAQWIAAMAAISSAVISVWAVRLVRDSLKVTREALDAAKEANSLTANSQRAWVTIDIYSAAPEGRNPDEILTINARFSNVGDTPAVDFCESFYAYYPPTETAIKSFFEGAYKHKAAGIGSGTLVPGETRDRNVFCITRTVVPLFEHYGGVCQVILGCVYDVPGKRAFSIKHLIVKREPTGFSCTTVKTDYV